MPYDLNDSKPGTSTLVEPISEPVSDSESIFDTPRKIVLKKKLLKEITAKKVLAYKFKKIQRQNRYLKKKCASYKFMVKDMKSKFGFDVQTLNDLMHKAELVELHKSFIKKVKGHKHSLLYTAPLRKFALTLNYYSPAAYKYVREAYNKALPHPRTICRWYSTVDAEPGFTEEAFNVLKKKSQVNEKPVLCSLVFDEMAIRSQKLFNKERKLGMVNFGAGPIVGEDEDTTATQALVFMLVSINENWKLPVGYFLIAGINAERKANLINICLEKCHEAGVTVTNLTFDGCATNLKAAEILGCRLTDLHCIKTHFPHPLTSEKVCIFLDPCHTIKLIRNTFERKRLMFDGNNGQIRWQLLINLNKLQQNEGLHFANKLTTRHISFRNQIMKVKLATQLLSMSVAKAITLCDQILKSDKFKDSSATVNFITLMNNFFDVMNSRKFHFYGFKRPIDKKNKSDIFAFLDEVKSFILQLQYQSKIKRIVRRKNRDPRIIMNITKQKIVESSNKTGFVGCIICIESMKTLYNYLVEEKNFIDYISMYRVSQDHLELFFGLIRKHGGYNNNPNILQFRAAYKKTLNHLELRSSFSGNCIPLDNFSILNASSVNIINTTSSLSRHDEVSYEVLQSTHALETDIEAEKNCEIFANMLNNENVTEASQLIVGYISGYVSRYLIKSLKCEECIDALTTRSKLPHHKLITIKDMGGLCYSSEDVYTVCLSTEMIIRHLIKKSGGKFLSLKYNLTYITVNTLKLFMEKEVFMCLIPHAFNQPSTLNHRIHLIRAVINKYSTIRLYHEAKITNDCLSERQKLTKLILFKGK